jgi:F-type H+-transporting ATPase subunit epsilon
VSVPEGKLLLSIVTPDRKVFEEPVDEVVVPGSEGYLGVLPGHAPLLTALQIGELSFRQAGRWHWCFLSGGFVEVLGDRVSVLADVSERGEEIDPDRARAARERAEGRIRKPSEDLDWDRARAALRRAVARLQILGRK